MAAFTSKQITATVLVFFMQFIYAGVFFSFAQYYPLMVKEFHSSYAFIGFIGTSVSGFSNFVGPVSSAMADRFGYAFVIPVAGLLVALAFILTSFEREAWELFFSYSVLFGLSCGTISHLSLSFLLEVLESQSEIALAMGISNIGTGLGYISISCFVAYFANVHTILNCSQVFFCLSATGFFIFIMSIIIFIFFPLDIDKDEQHNPSTLSDSDDGAGGDSSESDNILPRSENPEAPKRTIHGWELLCSSEGTSARLLFFSQIVGFSMTVVPFKFSIVFAASLSSDVNVYYYVPMAMGIGTVIARFTFSNLAGSVLPGMRVYQLLQFGSGVSCVILALLGTVQAHVAFVLLFLGVYACFNCHFPLVMLRTVELMGRHHHRSNFGVQCFAAGIGYCLGGFIAGEVYDLTGNFSSVFYASALIFFFSVLFDEFNFGFILHKLSNSCGADLVVRSY